MWIWLDDNFHFWVNYLLRLSLTTFTVLWIQRELQIKEEKLEKCDLKVKISLKKVANQDFARYRVYR